MTAHDFSHDELRRAAADTQDLHDSVMPAYGAQLDRLFDSSPTARLDEKAHAVLGGLDRRGFLKIGGLAVAGSAIVAACASDNGSSPSSLGGSTTTGGAMSGGADVMILRTASSIEELAVAVYQTAVDSGLVTTAAVGDAAKLFQSQHKEHSALFQSLTTQAGGTPFTDPNPAVLAQLQPTIDALADEMAIIQLAFDLETVAAQTYQKNVGNFTDLALNASIMTVGGVEARHAAVLAGVLSQAQAPVAFQVTDQAVAVGTGV